MDSKVTVIADEATGAVINQSPNNPKFGFVRIQQIRTMIDDNGFLKRKPVNALIQGEIDVLKESGFYAGQIIDGRIVIEEALTPFNTKNPERDLKVAGETNIVCTLAGQPIYRRTKLSLANNAEDKFIKHDNVEELRSAYNKSKSKIVPNEDFNLG